LKADFVEKLPWINRIAFVRTKKSY
jgi:hypothetical protein